MRTWHRFKPMLRIIVILLAVYALLVVVVYFRQRSMLFFPSHAPFTNRLLTPWSDGSRTIGFCREVTNAPAIWLMLHGNGGQAADRDYVLKCLPEQDSLYVVEYPGYGSRPGTPSLEAFNQAALEAYQLLRARNPNTPVCVLGESIGSGPASSLAREKIAPDKIVLVVPFDSLANVASKHFPFLPVRLLLRDAWDNIESLKHYNGPVEIFGAIDDGIIPIRHAKALAKQVPKAQLTLIPGVHNNWSDQVRIKP